MRQVGEVANAMGSDSENLTTLPEEVIDKIASCLSYEDRVSLARTHPNFGYMMPWEQIVEGRDLNSGKNMSADKNMRLREYVEVDRHACMDVPIVTRGLMSFELSFRWGAVASNDELSLQLQLFRDDNMIASSSPILFSDPGPGWDLQAVTLEVDNNPVVTKARKDDILKVQMHFPRRCIVVVRDVEMRITHKYAS